MSIHVLSELSLVSKYMSHGRFSKHFFIYYFKISKNFLSKLLRNGAKVLFFKFFGQLEDLILRNILFEAKAVFEF
jgi:hypothetical protein